MMIFCFRSVLPEPMDLSVVSVPLDLSCPCMHCCATTSSRPRRNWSTLLKVLKDVQSVHGDHDTSCTLVTLLSDHSTCSQATCAGAQDIVPFWRATRLFVVAPVAVMMVDVAVHVQLRKKWERL